MIIVETEQDYERFMGDFHSCDSLVIPVLGDQHQHPAVNPLTLVYVKFIRSGETYIVPFKHNELTSIPITIPRTRRLVYTPFKKVLMHCLPALGEQAQDVGGIEYMQTGAVTDVETFYPLAMKQMLGRFRSRQNVTQAIPVMVLIDFLDRYAEHLLKIIDKGILGEGFAFLNDTIIPAAHFMEQSGIHVDVNKVEDRFAHLVHNNLMYTEYNPYTAAGRLSSSHGGKNWVAMNKHDGSRELITSRFDRGILVLIDYESFHVRLIAKLLDFELPPTSLHTYFGCQYFNVTELTPEQYEESKRITFTLLYSDEEIESLPPFFGAVQEYRQRMYEAFQRDGYIWTPRGKQIRKDHMENPSPAKLFNYLVQMTETEVAMAGIEDLEYVFREYQSKVILYTYDSILIDFNLADGKELLDQTRNVLSQGDTYPVRMYAGPNYNNLKGCG